MQIEEFSKRTGFYPDSTLYNVIQREYERQDDKGNDIWWDKDEFCAAYRENRDGLAEKCQREADQEIWHTEEHHRQAMTSSADRSQTLFNECQTLREQLSATQERGDRFIEKCNVYRRTISEMKAGGIKADMFDILCQMEKYEYSRDEIFAAFSAFGMFLQKQNTEK